MNTEKLKELSTILLNVQADRKIKVLNATKNENILQGIYFNEKGGENPLKIEYFPKHKTVRASTDIPHFSDYRLAVQKVEVLEKFKAENKDYELLKKELEKPIITRTQLAEKFEKNEIKIVLHGHFAENKNDYMREEIKENFLRDLNHQKDGANGKFDGTWDSIKKSTDKKKIEKTNKEMRDFYKLDLKRPLKKYDKLSTMSDGKKCSACGCTYDIILLDENTVSIQPGYHMKEEGDLHLDCEFASGLPHTSGNINVSGGKLVFANFFPSLKEDTPKDKKYSDEYNLCYHSGRRNITKWKSENQNVAYGQMGNMSLSVWINDKKDRIILTEAYIESKKKMAKLKKMGMKQVKIAKRGGGDNISLAVWRWEATDINTVEKSEGKDINKFIEDMEKDCKDVIVASVKNGTWEFTHYYDTTPDPENEDELFIYAELKLKKKS